MLATTISRLRHQIYGSRLHARIVRGGVWLGAASLTAQGLRFGRNIVLARILVPESFGVMAIVLSISSMMDAFTEIGMKEALIQNRRGHEHGYVNSAWWLGFARALFIYFIVFALAPKVAAYYGLPSLSPLIRVALSALIFTGAISPQAFVALKQLNYQRWAVIQYGSGIAGTLLTVGFALLFRNVWGLALGFVAESACRCILSHALCPFRPSFRIQTDAARDLLRFSRGIFGLSFLNFIFARSDVFVLGKLISSAQLGIYTIGIYLAQVPASFALEWLAQVFMPLFSQFKDDRERINNMLATLISSIAIVGLPSIIFVLLTGDELLGYLYAPQYSAAFTSLVLAVVVAVLNVANGQITTVLYATGHPGLHRYCVGAMALIMMAVIVPAAQHWGAAGAQVAALAATSAGFATQLLQIQKLTGFRLVSLGRRLVIGSAPALCILALALGARLMLENRRPGFLWVSAILGSLFALALGLLSAARTNRFRHAEWAETELQ